MKPKNLFFNKFIKKEEELKKVVIASINRLIVNTSDRSDVLMDTYIKLANGLEKGYHEEGKIIQWAEQVTRNVCMDYHRKNSKRRSFLQDYSYWESNVIEDDNEYKVAKRREILDDYVKFLVSAPENSLEIQILKLYIIQREKKMTIARNLKISYKTVSRIIRKSTNAMRELDARTDDNCGIF